MVMLTNFSLNFRFSDLSPANLPQGTSPLDLALGFQQATISSRKRYNFTIPRVQLVTWPSI